MYCLFRIKMILFHLFKNESILDEKVTLAPEMLALADKVVECEPAIPEFIPGHTVLFSSISSNSKVRFYDIIFYHESF